MEIPEANRSSGKWLPDVKKCTNRAVPCGNPLCADEAMRASEIRRVPDPGTLGRIQADHAEDHAQQIARRCSVPQGQCPLDKFQSGQTRKEVLKRLSKP